MCYKQNSLQYIDFLKNFTSLDLHISISSGIYVTSHIIRPLNRHKSDVKREFKFQISFPRPVEQKKHISRFSPILMSPRLTHNQNENGFPGVKRREDFRVR